MRNFKLSMKKFFWLFILLFAFHLPSLGQTDPSNVLICDVVYMKDGRILKGEILIFEEKDGDLTFRDLDGKKYSITRKEYKYFVEDKRYLVKGNYGDTIQIRPRKELEYEFSIGFSSTIIRLHQELISDENFFSTVENTYLDAPLSFRLGFGKYFTRQHFIGMVADLGVISESKSYFGVGFRYVNQYDRYKKNVALYIPIELQFNSLSFDSEYRLNDPTGLPPNYNYFDLPIEKNQNVINSLGLHLGQGFNFMLENKKAISLEFEFYKNFIISQKIGAIKGQTPNTTFTSFGGKVSLFYNF